MNKSVIEWTEEIEEAREIVRCLVDAMIEGRLSRCRPYIALEAALRELEEAAGRELDGREWSEFPR